jgi:hypothetical protein
MAGGRLRAAWDLPRSPLQQSARPPLEVGAIAFMAERSLVAVQPGDRFVATGS